jgi:hypothetical protein
VALVVRPNEAIIYLNGVPFTNPGTHDPEAFDVPMILGNDPNSSARTFRGLMDEVCVYNRALSQDEIRELMHLSRKPANDSTLVTYLQFNEFSGVAYDKSNINHVSLAGGASRTTSTAPVGGGVSQRLTVNGSGTYAFGNTGLTLETQGQTFPNGEICVSRINLHPDALPSSQDSTSTAYWIIQNFGSNQQFDTLQSILFERTGIQFAQCNHHRLYTRGANADGPVWGTAIDVADNCSGALPNNQISYSQNNSVTQGGQFVIGGNISIPTSANWFEFAAIHI